MHEVMIEDSSGELIDTIPYCSDSCARTDSAYAGWFGCVETGQDAWCASCGARCSVDSEGECTWECLPVVVNVFPGYDSDPCQHGLPRYLTV
jgi:hypothetical protein